MNVHLISEKEMYIYFKPGNASNLEEGTWSSPEWPCKYGEIILPIPLRTWVLFVTSGTHSQEVKIHSVILLTLLMSGARLSPSITNTVVGKAESLPFKGGVTLSASYCRFWRQSLCPYGEGLLDVSLRNWTLPGDQQQVEYFQGLSWDLSCLMPLMTWRGWNTC